MIPRYAAATDGKPAAVSAGATTPSVVQMRPSGSGDALAIEAKRTAMPKNAALMIQ